MDTGTVSRLEPDRRRVLGLVTVADHPSNRVMARSPRRPLWPAIMVGVIVGFVAVVILRAAGVAGNAAPIVGGITGAAVVVLWPLLRRL